MDDLENTLFRENEKIEGKEFLNYTEHIHQKGGEGEEMSREETVRSCPLPKLDYRLIQEKEYFNKDVFRKVQSSYGFGRGIGKMGKYTKP